MSETTQASAESPALGSSEEAVNAFMSQWQSAEKPDEPEAKGDTEPAEVRAAEEVPVQETIEETEIDLPADQADEEYEYVTVEVDEDGNERVIEDAAPAQVADDEMSTRVKVGNEEFEVPVKDLKRLYGQEKALTQKSQEVATQRKALEDRALQYEAALTKLMERAQERFKPYAEVDMLLAAKTMDDQDFMNLRREAEAASQDVRFLSEEMDKYANEVKQAQQAQLQEQAKAAVKVLQDTVPDWSPDLYNEMRAYATKSGLPADVVDNIVEPAAIHMMIKAMRYDQGVKTAQTKRTKRVKRVLKSGAASSSATTKQRQTQSLDRLQKTGTTDDAAAAFMARWQR